MRELLELLPSWVEGVDKITVYRMEIKDMTLGWGTDKERKVKATYLYGTLGNSKFSGGTEVVMTVLDDPKIPWFAQIARFRFSDFTLWRLHEF